ncbi:unnamed protein product [Brachionus calyciflorus]|uniref:DDE-1 domain-containing protein n=1 Tax=Brachionus calyciflorus TaxID=104777 RepID=A0A813MMB2_9BILA|nr:unnamed protein product [Brachionus calyciflorus]
MNLSGDDKNNYGQVNQEGMSSICSNSGIERLNEQNNTFSFVQLSKLASAFTIFDYFTSNWPNKTTQEDVVQHVSEFATLEEIKELTPKRIKSNSKIVVGPKQLSKLASAFTIFDYFTSNWPNKTTQEDVVQHVSEFATLEEIKELTPNGHEVTKEFSNIKLMFLPPNCTSLLQPLDQGIISNFKLKYRPKILQSIVKAIDNMEHLEDLSIKEAIDNIVISWNDVKPLTIKNCFKKAGFKCEEEEEIVDENLEKENYVDIWNEIKKKIQNLIKYHSKTMLKLMMN